MYATMKETDSVAAARAFAEYGAQGAEHARLPILEEQICAEAGIWAPEVAGRAARQAGGDIPRAVALLKVWAAALPHVAALPVEPADVCILRRLSSAYSEIPGGQWLGVAPELASRLLDWSDESAHPVAEAPRRHQHEPEHSASDGETGGLISAGASDGETANTAERAGGADAPTRAETPRVRSLLRDVPVAAVPEDSDGHDPALGSPGVSHDRATRTGIMARGETASLVAFAALVLGRRREAVLAEMTTADVTVRVRHPRTGRPCAVAEVPIVEAEAVIDAEVEGRAGFAIGWGASLGSIERRAISLALLDGAMQADGDLEEPLMLDEPTLLGATDGSANNGFVEHLRLPHHASFGSYLSQARTDRNGESQAKADGHGESQAKVDGNGEMT
ncbi:carbon-phosphorus lyase complex subunit PhnI [Brevibacterium daeguense]|uniref:Carbon-phosphorus lyase complex subunit PhnI n=1 Tax=Brevibacterium daeguense TaxID=909936 RepID=A0ABP8EH54_9MICO|nr:carbon-phosphorus lyase complex subunit PhnI [Brevibacterium daeguense]